MFGSRLIRVRGLVLFSFFVVFALFSSSVFAVDYLDFDVVALNGTYFFSDVKLVGGIKPYESVILAGGAKESGLEARLVDGSGKLLVSLPVSEGEFAIRFDDKMLALQLYLDGSLIKDLPLSFCDYDGVCDVCSGLDCVLAEDSLTCGDCASGSADMYCDIRKDGLCDIDCAGAFDSDCSTCASSCYDEDSGKLRYFCSEYGGTLCFSGDGCLGQEVKTLDVGSVCCIGSCGTPEDVEFLDDMEKYPEAAASLTPTIRTADDEALKMTTFYDADGLPYQVYVPDSFENSYSMDEARRLDLEVALAEEAENVSEDIKISAAAIALEEDKSAVRDSILADLAAQEELDKEAEAEKRFGGFNLLTFVVALLVVVFLVSAVVWFFRRGSGANAPVTSSGGASLQVAPKDDAEVRMFQVIQDLRQKGYSHDQLRSWLVEQGYDPAVVDRQIGLSAQQESAALRSSGRGGA